MTEWVEQGIWIRFCIKFEHSSAKTIQMIQKAAAVGNCWLVASYNNPPIHASRLMQTFLMKHQITQVTQPSYSPDLAVCDFWLFQKLKSPLKGKRFQTISEMQENTMEQLMEIGRTVWGPTVPTLKGTVRHHCPSIMFLVCFIFSINVSIFHITWLGTFWRDLVHYLI